jgi:anaerobic selenocysteine-containing dehydrogenase
VASEPTVALRIPARSAPDAETQITDFVDEILAPGEGRIRALLCLGGNPAAAWPNQAKTVEALRSLDLLVVVDPVMTATAKLAHVVVAPKLMLEVPALTLGGSASPSNTGGPSGYVESFAQYTPPALEPPAGADVIEEWEMLVGVAGRLGRTMRIGRNELDPKAVTTTDDILAMLTRSARVPLDEVKRHPHGAHFVDEAIKVLPAEPGWPGRLDVANADMLAELATFDTPASRDGFPFRLTSRRMVHVQNSMLHGYSAPRAEAHNPAFLHPDDLRDLALVEGDWVKISSAAGSIRGRVAADPGLRRGVVSMSHCFGDLPEIEDQSGGTNTGRLVDVDHDFDAYSGQPLMSNVPVRVERSRADGGGSRSSGGGQSTSDLAPLA